MRRSTVLLLGLSLPAAGLAALGWLASAHLLKRVEPDPSDPPDNYDLAFDAVAFSSRDGTPLHGWWVRPAVPNGRTLVVCHGRNGSMDGDTVQVARFVRLGYSVLMFNLRGHGTSGGDQVTFGAMEIFDVRGALDWLEEAHGIKRVGLLGFSMGAGLALVAAAQDSRVAAVVADGAFGHLRDPIMHSWQDHGLPGWMSLLFATAILIGASLRVKFWLPMVDALRWTARVRCPVLLVHGTRDRFTTTTEATRLAASIGEHAVLWVVPGAGHRDAYEHEPDAYYGGVAGFFAEHLG